MKQLKLIKPLLFLILLVGVERFTRSQTDGFRVEKTLFDAVEAVESTHQSPPPHEVLEKPFYFLGSGAQFYAFVSEDNQTVLKLFKHYHMWPSSRILKQAPLPSFLHKWREKTLEKRRERMTNIFSSAQIALNPLSKETGVYALRLSPCKTSYPTVTLYDKIGVLHTLDLNNAPFVLQKRAELITSFDETMADLIVAAIKHRCKKGVINQDPVPYRNFGILDSNVVEIDLGSFKKIEGSYDQVFNAQVVAIKQWISKHNRKVDQAVLEKVIHYE